MKLSEILLTAVNAVLPIVLTIMLGYVLKQKKFLTAEFVSIGNKLVFNVCLPCMLFVNVYEINGLADICWDVVIYTCLAIFVIFLIGIAFAVLVTPEPKRRGVITQAGFRSNMAIIGLALASSLGGADAVAVAAIVSAFTVPIFNILAVVALTMFLDGDGGKNRFRGVVQKIVTNPLIIGIGIGMVCLVIREWQVSVFNQPVFLLSRDLGFVYKVLKNLSAITSPFALLVLGGQFVFSAVKDLRKEILVGTLCRIVISPLIGIGAAALLSTVGLIQCGPNEYPALIAVFGSPAAVSSAIMAKQMDNDEQLATQLVVWTSIGSIVTIFLTVCILMACGLLNG